MIHIINNKEKISISNIDRCPKCKKITDKSTFIQYDNNKKIKILICKNCGHKVTI